MSLVQTTVIRENIACVESFSYISTKKLCALGTVYTLEAL
ncbi:hypothetical protein HMPREF3232_00561 [Fannyhessea vaginae]|uniref:Uncharacterized protein n=1 Tax=Fannyhessea vaginae DSM 15829 TaxID=525256 RepID=F1T4M8_9ACTN|nr:hypothetical protein HMPREF0091_10619 [Fannyhessea vaginae DSM 15829]KXG90632.1 hypothetical protein HMPREF3232_00561 [Fannyhessea vaginae]